ncbi:MAG: sigma 54-interacting transcriptional regulator [Thermodesulfobacteriota bacterium]
MKNNNIKDISIALFSKDSNLLDKIQSYINKQNILSIQDEVPENFESDISLLDVDTTGISLLSKLKNNSFVIILTREKGSRYMIESMTFGAFDCISIPTSKELFLESVNKASGIKNELSKDLINYSGDVEGGGVACAIVGDSPMLQEVCKLIGQMGRVDVPILITGESGTGKDLVAESIWKVSTRWEKPFVTINCAAIPEPLLEAELFGYERGAFTGASSDRVGKFEEANGGVLFLDEIGDMSLSLQAKILRVLQNGTFQRLGDNRNIKVDIRVIAATNKKLERLVEEGSFREDLYFRINVVNLNLPALKERKEDIPLLSECFIRRYSSQMGKEISGVTKSFLNRLVDHDWPGNVRELENTIRKAIAFTKTDYLTSYDIDLNEEPPHRNDKNKETFENTFRKSVKEIIKSDNSSNIYRDLLKDAESILLDEAMKSTDGNRSKASRLLGINRLTLLRKLKEYGV